MKRAIFETKNILILGGAGFIGSQLCDELVKEFKVICVDNFSSGAESNIDQLLANPHFKFIKHDMTETLNLETFPELADFKVEFQGIQEIYNLACPTSAADFDKNRAAMILANSYVVKNALDLAIKYQAKLVQASSAVIYGPRQGTGKIAESTVGLVDQLGERCSYDEGKRFAESLIKTYRDVYQVDAKIARLFRIYGPRMPLGHGHLIPDFIANALDNADLTIFGDAGFASSFCYIDDCVNALLKLMASDLAGPINIGSDMDVNLTDVAQKVIDLLDSGAKISYAEPKLFTSPLPLPDITLARDQLDWLPLVDLEHGLSKTIDDLRATKNLKHL